MNQKGFTLLETLIAMIILSSGIILLVNSWGGSFTRIRKTEMHVEVSALLEKKMAEIESEYRGKSIEGIPEEKEDDFGSDYPKYSWKLESKNFPMPDLSASLTAVEGTKPEMLMVIKQFTEHISKSVKEVKVTVFYNGGKKPLSFSAVTYFVDFDRTPPALSGGG